MGGHRDVAIRHMPRDEYEDAKRAAGARGMNVGEYLARCVKLHQRIVNSDQPIRAVLKELELEATRQ